MTRRPADRPGLTLVELLVVLAILAATATIAVRQMAPLQQQARYDATVRTLTDVRSAILGAPGTASGFVADVGRLPRSVAGESAFGQTDWLGELLDGGGLPGYRVLPAPADPQVFVGTGWQGPYVRLGVGVPSVRDGWGTPLQARNGVTPITAAGVPVTAVFSLGADRQIDPPTGPVGPFDRDIGFAVNGSVAADGWQSNVTVSVQMFDPAIPGLTAPPGDVTVYYFGPDGNGGVAQVPLLATGSAGWTATFTNLPAGTRTFRAYFDPATPSALTTPAAALAATGRSSPPVTVNLRPGSQTITLVIR
jgi:prepilin-type N-terminal cleavage/methylation domain-containing protein